MIKKERRHVEKTHPHHIAIVARATVDETERIAIELAHDTHDRRALRAGRTLGFHGLTRTFSQSRPHVIFLKTMNIWPLTGLPQQICIDPWRTPGNHNRSHCLTIKLNRPRAANNAVNVAEFTQAPQRRHQQCLPDSVTTFVF